MLKNPSDSRAQRTEKRLKETMLTLLRERPIHEITTVELCRKSQVNRATFYDHFQDIYDLVDRLENELLSDLNGLMAGLDTPDVSPEQVSGRFFGFIRLHGESLSLLLNGETSLRFARKLDEAILPFFERKVRQIYQIPLGEKEKELQVALRFLASGYYSLYWCSLHGGDVEDVSGIAARMSDYCLSCLFGKKEMREKEGQEERTNACRGF